MGCSLCSLRKREEHYKLLYEIAQVNGKDLSKVGSEETLETFRSTKDPIMVQVLRRHPMAKGMAGSQEVQLVDVCTQTDITFEHIMALAKLRPTTPPVPDICPFLLSDSCHSLQTMEQDYYGGPEYLSSMQADGDRTDDFEYEEVELCRLNSQEKLGLTLCYRTDDEEDVAIYVSEVGPNTIAARDGRIREGDRILQINGRDIQDRVEAVAMLSSEDCRNLVLLVARPGLQMDEAWLDDEHNEFLEELKREMLEEQEREEACQRSHDEEVSRDTPTCSSAQNKLQGKCSEQDLLSHIRCRLSRQGSPSKGGLIPGGRLSSLCPGVLPEEEEDVEEEEEVGERFQQLLELKCQIRNSGEYDVYYRRHSTIQCSLTEQDGVGRELRMLNEELRSIEVECQNIMQAHKLRKGPDGGGRGRKLADINEHPERSDKDSSSAYNTAESCRSTPLAMDRSPDHTRAAAAGERSPDHSLQRRVRTANQRNLHCTLMAAATVPHPPPTLLSSSPDQSNPSESDHLLPADDEGCGRETSPRLHPLLVAPPPEPRMEWKVKVRGDGTRYITKRPARDRILRERALKIREERGGTTTDDDAMSELKTGRYWSKEERKQQLARAREQRRRREFMQRCRLEGLAREASPSAAIVELSHRKMMKKRNKKILDNWMTIQELMTHGARPAEGARVHNAFLSVTTV